MKPINLQVGVRFRTPEQKEVVQNAVEKINKSAEIGAEATLNSFITAAAEKEARRVLNKKKN